MPLHYHKKQGMINAINHGTDTASVEVQVAIVERPGRSVSRTCSRQARLLLRQGLLKMIGRRKRLLATSAPDEERYSSWIPSSASGADPAMAAKAQAAALKRRPSWQAGLLARQLSGKQKGDKPVRGQREIRGPWTNRHGPCASPSPTGVPSFWAWRVRASYLLVSRGIFEFRPCSPWPHPAACFLLRPGWGSSVRSAFPAPLEDKPWQHPGL